MRQGFFAVDSPKRFAQDTVVTAELLGEDVPMQKYWVRITVAEERAGALLGSTLREDCRHAGAWNQRKPRRFADIGTGTVCQAM